MYTLGFFGGQRVVQNEPGMFIGPIATVFGLIIDVIFDIVYNLNPINSLGISIILLTLVVRTLMLPLGIKQQKSMMAMQVLTPEVNKIRKKYSGKKDQQSQQKMNAEIQKLYADHKVNPLGGCLPLFIQMPLFFGLSFIMHQSHLYVTKLGNLFAQIPTYLRATLGDNEYIYMMNSLLVPNGIPIDILPQRMIDEGTINLLHTPDVSRVLNAFGPEEWSRLFATVPSAYLQDVYSQITDIRTFFNMELTESAGIGWPGILIPILAVATALLTSWVTLKASVVTDEAQKRQQKMMMVVMPVMMGAMTIGLPLGVGVFWITSSVYQVFQQLFMNKIMGIGKNTVQTTEYCQ